jgi:hypothetical protein
MAKLVATFLKLFTANIPKELNLKKLVIKELSYL